MTATALDFPIGEPARIDVTIVMPCLNEALCLPICITNAREALRLMRQRLAMNGEIVIADNGSTDGSQGLAESLGARVVEVTQRGYGAALIGGCRAAQGRYIVMGDCDGSYDFCEALDMVAALRNGADLVMGNRFLGGIEAGAMPWKNRYIGNPVLTGGLNLLFRSGVGDAHCGLRAFTRSCFDELGLTGAGMEFASEMVIKAALKKVDIVETPATLKRDMRDRPPHLRPWRDGWRHLRYLLMLSPAWLFGAPAALLGVAALLVLAYASVMAFMGLSGVTRVGNYWVILAGAMLGVSHAGLLLAAATQLYGVRAGYRRSSAWTTRLAKWVSLETMLLSGLALAGLGLSGGLGILAWWSAGQYGAIGNVLPAVLGAGALVLGMQNMLGGFLLAIINGNEANFLAQTPATQTPATQTPATWASPAPAATQQPGEPRRATAG